MNYTWEIWWKVITIHVAYFGIVWNLIERTTKLLKTATELISYYVHSGKQLESGSIVKNKVEEFLLMWVSNASSSLWNVPWLIRCKDDTN